MKVLVVEPHPDDACFSIHTVLSKIKENFEITLLSLYRTEKNNSLKYCKTIGINYSELGFGEEVHFLNRISSSVLRKENDSFEFLRREFGEKYRNKIIEIGKEIDKVIDEFSIVISPIGIYHPWHVITSIALEKTERSLIRYSEIPYSQRKYGARLVSESKLVKLLSCVPSENKIKIAYDSYPEGRGTLRFDRDNVAFSEEALYLEGRFRL